jgi:polyprenyl-phospho-N-acetylgalactosaminyl synthase
MYQLPPDKKIMVLLPVFNEAPEVVQSVVQQLAKLSVDVVIIDDGSAEPLKLPALKNQTIIRHAVNLGQGAALQTGFEFAKRKQADYAVTFDADGQHQVHDIYSLLQPLLADAADVVLGSRFLSGVDEQIPAGRKRTLQLARRINYLFTGLRLSDVHNGLRALNKKALHAIRLKENRMAHATEIITEIRKQRLRYKEIPVHITYTAYSRKKGQSVFSAVRIFFDLLLHKLFE